MLRISWGRCVIPLRYIPCLASELGFLILSLNQNQEKNKFKF